MSLLRQLREAGLWDSSFCGFCIVSCIFEPEARFTLLRRHTIFTLALFVAGTIAAYGYGFRTAQEQLWPYRQLKSFIELQSNAPAKFDIYGRLIDYPGKLKIDCPPQDEKTAVLLIFGQSNSANYGGQRFQAMDDHVINYFSGKCYRASSPLLGAENKLGETWTLLGNKLIEQRRFNRVVLIPAGIGGTSVSEWAAGGRLNSMLADVLDNAQQHYRITHVLWHQGERDFVIGTSAKDYASRFLSVYATLRAHEVAAPVYISEASRAGPEGPPWSENNPVRAGEESLIDGKNIFAGPDTDILVSERDRYDGMHFSGSGTSLSRSPAPRSAWSYGR